MNNLISITISHHNSPTRAIITTMIITFTPATHSHHQLSGSLPATIITITSTHFNHQLLSITNNHHPLSLPTTIITITSSHFHHQPLSITINHRPLSLRATKITITSSHSNHCQSLSTSITTIHHNHHNF